MDYLPLPHKNIQIPQTRNPSPLHEKIEVAGFSYQAFTEHLAYEPDSEGGRPFPFQLNESPDWDSPVWTLNQFQICCST